MAEFCVYFVTSRGGRPTADVVCIAFVRHRGGPNERRPISKSVRGGKARNQPRTRMWLPYQSWLTDYFGFFGR